MHLQCFQGSTEPLTQGVPLDRLDGGTNHDMSPPCFKIQLVWQGMVLMPVANDVSREHDAT